MPEARRPDTEVVDELLEGLRAEQVSAPPDLPQRTMRRVRASITARDLLDLSTAVFLLRFCAPILDLVAAMLGWHEANEDRRSNDE